MNTLTEKEQALYDAIVAGMDEPGCGWLHELSPYDNKTNSGLVSSLVKKGLIRSELIEEDNCYWVFLV